jgi:hypothetical protein
MKRKLFLNISLLLVVILLNSGCSINRATANLDPSADLGSIKSIHVTKFAPDGREINILIANKLKEMGYQTSSGIDTPAGVDMVVTYKDKWMWDITMYMLELTIVFRDAKTDFPLASGNSYHTSFTRRTPEEMVDEVIDNIFKQQKQ